MTKTLFSTAFVLLAGLTTINADALTTRAVCGQAGIVKWPASDAGKWYNSYCYMQQNASTSGWLELDYPLAVDPNGGNVSGWYNSYCSGTGSAQVAAQLLTLDGNGALLAATNANCSGSTPSLKGVGFSVDFAVLPAQPG
jgi:hypothetical protein